MCMLENMNVFFTSCVYVQLKYCVFEGFFYCYSATYGPIAMKLCMVVKGHLTHVFTNFRKVSSFCLGFIGLGFMWPRPLLVNEPIKANQRTKFHFFSIIIDLGESRDYYCSGLIEIEKKTRGLVRKSSFLQIYEYLINDLIDNNGSRGKVAQYDESYQMICILCG